MTLPQHCELVDGILYFRPSGPIGVPVIIDQMLELIKFARGHRTAKLLANLTRIETSVWPNLAQRYFYMRELAGAAQGMVRIAFAMPAEAIDPEKFGVLVGRNAGLDNEVFTNEPEAVAWLSARP